ncbi:MAG: 2-amino-4-hydroxy-6-hydroxymethyldihydropteridine diphosphokinase [Rhodospirillales bacterium]|nr:2-amino-4-hydroxy-6-hydroxymethyldihydropteridine diphosphokinase [Rhodospirillales bacterium]
MIYIGIGGNQPSARFGSPPASLEVALVRLAGRGITITARSRWYRTAPLPPSSQPHYINGVASARSDLRPALLLAVLHEIECEFGRVRGEVNEARCLDLDLLAYDELVVSEGAASLRLPHPRLAERAFVLAPWAELAPEWRHPLSGLTVQEMLDALPGDQQIEVLRP